MACPAAYVEPCLLDEVVYADGKVILASWKGHKIFSSKLNKTICVYPYCNILYTWTLTIVACPAAYIEPCLLDEVVYADEL